MTALVHAPTDVHTAMQAYRRIGKLTRCGIVWCHWCIDTEDQVEHVVLVSLDAVTCEACKREVADALRR